MNSGNSNKEDISRQKRPRRILLWLAIAISILVLLYLAIGGYAVSEVTKIGDHIQYSNTPETYGVDFEDVRFTARGDETEIAAWYLPNADSRSAVIMVHGRNASKQNAVSGNFPKLGADLHNAGYAVLMVDTRGHGESDGERYSFGVYERRDVLGAVDWLLEQGFQPGDIGILSISMGGAASIGAAAEEPAIGAIVLESTLADLGLLVETGWQEESGLPNFFLPGVFIMNRLLFGYDIPGVRPVEEIEKIAPRPIMIIHCTEDESIPLVHADELLQAAPGAESWIVGGCDHAEIYRDHGQEYEYRLVAFLHEHLE